MSQTALCDALKARHIVRFYYAGTEEPGYRTVEPYMVAYNQTDNLVLSAWYLSGASESQGGPGWRKYLLSEIGQVTDLGEQFDGFRPGYQPGGGKTFHNVQCAV